MDKSTSQETRRQRHSCSQHNFAFWRQSFIPTAFLFVQQLDDLEKDDRKEGRKKGKKKERKKEKRKRVIEQCIYCKVKQDRQNTYNETLRLVRAAIVVVENQCRYYLSVCL